MPIAQQLHDNVSCAVKTTEAEAGNYTVDSQRLECSGTAATDLLHDKKHGLASTQPLSTLSAICEAGSQVLTMRLEEFSRRASDALTAATNLYDGCFCRPRPTRCCHLVCTDVLQSVNQSDV